MSNSLTQLERDDWGAPPRDAPPHVKTCYELRNKRLKDFDVEDLRMLIGQDIGLPFLMPMAIDRLVVNPFSRGKHYSGDLLASVLSASQGYFRSNPDIHRKVAELLTRARELLPTLDEIDQEFAGEALEEAAQRFFLLH